ncbi:MAG: hypothetical protein AB7H96_15695 [Vicinamibacterales bacterium]
MKTCRDVSHQLSTGDLGQAPLLERAAVWLHLAMCRHCRTFSRQLRAIGRSARRRASIADAEPPASFERDIVDRLRR